MQTNQNTLRTSLVYGLVSGAALGISEIALFYVLLLIPYPLAFFIARASVFLLVLAYFYAGYHASRVTRQLFAGTLAGALTGVFAIATIFVFIHVVSFIGMGILFSPQNFLGLPANAIVASSLLSPLARIVLTFAFYGAIAGTLAGYIGKRSSLH